MAQPSEHRFGRQVVLWLDLVAHWEVPPVASRSANGYPDDVAVRPCPARAEVKQVRVFRFAVDRDAGSGRQVWEVCRRPPPSVWYRRHRSIYLDAPPGNYGIFPEHPGGINA